MGQQNKSSSSADGKGMTRPYRVVWLEGGNSLPRSPRPPALAAVTSRGVLFRSRSTTRVVSRCPAESTPADRAKDTALFTRYPDL